MKALVLALACSTGCAQLLGLESTKFDQKDAMTDGASVCDGAPMCVSTTGRSVCGVIIDTGAMAGLPVRAPSFTGAPCTGALATDGPCALSVYGQPMASYFAGTASDQIVGTIDDCGRFVVPDLPATNADIAVVFDGSTILESATLLVGRPTVAGAVDTGLEALMVRTATESTWGTQINSASPPGLTGSFLVSYDTTSTDPIKARVDGGDLAMPTTQPWGVYFTGAPYSVLDPTQTATTPNNTVLIVPGSGSHVIDGSRPGKSCGQVTVQPVGTALVHTTLKC